MWLLVLGKDSQHTEFWIQELSGALVEGKPKLPLKQPFETTEKWDINPFSTQLVREQADYPCA
jgi:hypothetical protein